MSEICNENICPDWTQWTDWTECTVSCGGGIRKKVRECVLPKNVDGCDGDSEIEETCNNQDCPVWTPWTDWTPCTKTCGGGTQRRDRQCVLLLKSGSEFENEIYAHLILKSFMEGINLYFLNLFHGLMFCSRFQPIQLLKKTISS